MKIKPAIAAVEIRRRAEAQLRARPQPSTATGVLKSAADSQRLLHELQVHQVELETQNAELRQARDELEAALENFTDLYDFAPVGYFTLTAAGVINQVNLTGANLVGIERARLVSRSFGMLVRPELRSIFHSFLKKVFASQTKLSMELEFLGQSGQPLRAVNLEARRLLNGQECRVAVMDITDRKRVEEKVRVSEIRYRRLFETAHDGVLLLNPVTRKITDANPFMTKLLGYAHAQLVGKELFEIGLLKDETASQEMFQKLKRDREVRYEDLPLKSQSGRHQEVEVVANLYQEDGHAVIQCNIRDITQRKATEIAANRLAAIVEFSDDGIIGKTPAGIITSWNSGAENIFGYAAHEMVGTSIMRLIPDDRRDEEQGILAKISSGKGVKHFETLRKTKDGHLIQVSVTSSPIKDGTGKIVGASKVVRDITVRKQAEATQRRVEVLAASNQKLEAEIIQRLAVEQSLKQSQRLQAQLLVEARQLQAELRQLSREILHTQEEERKRISRELHDVIAQTLTGINVRLATLKKSAGRSSQDFDRNLERTQMLIGKSVDIVHEFARELRPAVLDDLGLIPALHSFLKDFTARTGVRTQLTSFADVEKLDIAKRTALFRVAQEALTNVSRHAHASRVEVSLQKCAGSLSLKIKDDGKSFQAQRGLRARGSKRLGLLGMRERVEMVGGTFGIESAPGKGTTVQVIIPFTRGAA